MSYLTIQLFRMLRWMPFGSHLTDYIARKSSSRRFWFTLILAASTLFDFLLVVVRNHMRDFDLTNLNTWSNIVEQRGATATFLFLVWNLILAWVPFFITSYLRWFDNRNSTATWAKLPLFVAWLLFFPNAPYILTDLVHLHERAGIPFWFDMMMILSFAWTGLMLGYASLHDIHQWLQRRLTTVQSTTIVGLCLVLCSFGVYLGRYQRWNSWDILTNPFSLIIDVCSILFNPTWSALGINILFTVFLTLGYLQFLTARGVRRVG